MLAIPDMCYTQLFMTVQQQESYTCMYWGGCKATGHASKFTGSEFLMFKIIHSPVTKLFSIFVN